MSLSLIRPLLTQITLVCIVNLAHCELCLSYRAISSIHNLSRLTSKNYSCSPDFVNMLSEEVVCLQTVASQFENTIESLKHYVEFETGFLQDTYSRGFGSEEEGENAINIGQNVRKFLDNTLKKKVHDTVDQHRNNLARLT